MDLICPYCKHPAKVKNPKAGKFTPKCPKCGKPFVVVIPKDLQATLFIEGLETEQGGAPAPAKPKAAKPPQTPPAAEAGATGEYQPAGPQASATGEYEPAEGDTPEAAAAAVKPARKKEASIGSDDLPPTLGGYQVVKELGRGGMGAVYLGRQLSLDRPVALKVMRAELSSKPRYVARFTREAYAAAQLVHHNVVQIYDIGADGGRNFFSMEFVQGQSLGDLIKKKGKLDVEAAVGYVLQAARGLKLGHDLGMIHRDIKPDNLMLNDHGVVKVADLGLVKLPEADETDEADPAPAARSALIGPADITRVGTAIGTPAFMAPEQGKDSAHVDARADIYSLGCTLYVLLTGKPPFEGASVLEVLTKHATAPVVPPEVIVKRVPKEISAILLRMMAKKPEDRYADLGEVIGELERFLGIHTAGPFTPKDEHADALEQCVQRFNGAPRARLRSYVILGFFAACALLIPVLLLLGQPLWAGGFLGLGILTPLCYLVIEGASRRTPLFLKFRELLFGSRWLDWLKWLAGAAFVVLILYLSSLLWVWLGFCVAALALAAVFHFVVDRQVLAQRQGCLDEAEKLFRSMRLLGLDEETLRRFACKYSGKRWEAFYEALFGYEAKLAARDWDRGETGKAREKDGAWREPLIQWLEAKLRARREARERQLLQSVEEKALQSQGVDAGAARRQAEELARALVEEAAEIKQAARQRADEQGVNLRRLLQTARRPETTFRLQADRPKAGARLDLVGLVLGAKPRFVVGAVLVTGCLWWVHQNELISRQKLKEVAAGVQDLQDVTDTEEIKEAAGRAAEKAKELRIEQKETRPLSLPVLPEALTGLFDSFNPGAAGLLLLLSCLFRGWRLGVLVWPAALVAWLGPRLGMPALGPVSAQQASMVLGAALAVAGIFFLRERR